MQLEGPEWTSWTGGCEGGRREGASEPVKPVLLRPIVESGVTRPVIVSWRLMSGADSEHVSGSWERRRPGECGVDLQGKWSGHKAGQAAQARFSQAKNATLSTFNMDPRIHLLDETSVKLFNVGQNPTRQVLLSGRSLPVFSVCLLVVFAAWTKTEQHRSDPGRRTGTFEKIRLPPRWKVKPK